MDENSLGNWRNLGNIHFFSLMVWSLHNRINCQFYNSTEMTVKYTHRDLVLNKLKAYSWGLQGRKMSLDLELPKTGYSFGSDGLWEAYSAFLSFSRLNFTKQSDFNEGWISTGYRHPSNLSLKPKESMEDSQNLPENDPPNARANHLAKVHWSGAVWVFSST